MFSMFLFSVYVDVLFDPYMPDDIPRARILIIAGFHLTSSWRLYHGDVSRPQ